MKVNIVIFFLTYTMSALTSVVSEIMREPEKLDSMLRDSPNHHVQHCPRKERRSLTSGLRKLYRTSVFVNGFVINPDSMPVPQCFKDPHIMSRRNLKTTLHQGIRSTGTCSEGPISSTQNDAASCPWYYNLTYDRNRRPKNLIQAVCRCRDCTDNTGRRSGGCETVDVHYPVLRRRLNRRRWEATVETVSVACICRRNVTGQ